MGAMRAYRPKLRPPRAPVASPAPLHDQAAHVEISLQLASKTIGTKFVPNGCADLIVFADAMEFVAQASSRSVAAAGLLFVLAAGTHAIPWLSKIVTEEVLIPHDLGALKVYFGKLCEEYSKHPSTVVKPTWVAHGQGYMGSVTGMHPIQAMRASDDACGIFKGLVGALEPLVMDILQSRGLNAEHIEAALAAIESSKLPLHLPRGEQAVKTPNGYCAMRIVRSFITWGMTTRRLDATPIPEAIFESFWRRQRFAKHLWPISNALEFDTYERRLAQVTRDLIPQPLLKSRSIACGDVAIWPLTFVWLCEVATLIDCTPRARMNRLLRTPTAAYDSVRAATVTTAVQRGAVGRSQLVFVSNAVLRAIKGYEGPLGDVQSENLRTWLADTSERHAAAHSLAYAGSRAAKRAEEAQAAHEDVFKETPKQRSRSGTFVAAAGADCIDEAVRKAERSQRRQKRAAKDKEFVKKVNAQRRAFPVLSFAKLIKELIVSIVGEDGRLYKMQPVAILLLQDAAEHWLFDVLAKANQLAVQAKRRTLMTKDLQLLRSLLEEEGLAIAHSWVLEQQKMEQRAAKRRKITSGAQPPAAAAPDGSRLESERRWSTKAGSEAAMSASAAEIADSHVESPTRRLSGASTMTWGSEDLDLDLPASSTCASSVSPIPKASRDSACPLALLAVLAVVGRRLISFLAYADSARMVLA